MGVLEFLVPFYPINTAWVVFSSYLKMDPLNLYPSRTVEIIKYAFYKTFSNIYCTCLVSSQNCYITVKLRSSTPRIPTPNCPWKYIYWMLTSTFWKCPYKYLVITTKKGLAVLFCSVLQKCTFLSKFIFSMKIGVIR